VVVKWSLRGEQTGKKDGGHLNSRKLTAEHKKGKYSGSGRRCLLNRRPIEQ
jgi:hypothetical protein